MTVITHEILIASNFEEFAELRPRLQAKLESYPGLPMRAICLDDDRPRPNSPLHHSLEAARRCDVMVLLIGRRYGGCPEGEARSYAHLEHEAALEADSEPMVLVYYFDTPEPEQNAAQEDPRLAAWRRELDRVHVHGRLSLATDPELLASEICAAVAGRISESSSSSERERIDDAAGDDGLGTADPAMLDTDELTFLERRSGAPRTSGQEGDDLISRDDLLRNPAQVAALEQRDQALKALELGERKPAVTHFRRALDHRPLDLDSCHGLARLLSASGRRSDCLEAVELALRAAKIASHEGRPVRAAASRIVAARAAARLDDHDLSLRLAREAASVAPWLADAHREVACAHARRDEIEQALDAAGDAFFCYPPVLRKLRRDPAFQRHRNELTEFEAGLRRRLAAAVGDILEVEGRVLAPLNRSSDRPDVVEQARRRLSEGGLLDLVREGLESGRRAIAGLGRHADNIQRGALAARTEKDRLAELRQDWENWRRTEKPRLEEARPKRSLAFTGLTLLVTLPLAAMTLLASLANGRPEEVPLVATVLVALTLATLTVLAFEIYGYQRRLREWRGRLDDVDRESRDAVESIAASAQALDERASRVVAAAEHYQRLVVAFEETALRWAILSPGRGGRDPEPGQLVRWSDESAKDVKIDEALLPKSLRHEIRLPADEAPKHRLYKVVSVRGRRVAARWACYFEPGS